MATGLINAYKEEGYISEDNLRWLKKIFKKLEPAVNSSDYRRLIHADGHPGNIMIDDGHVSSLLDWGDAGWGDPAMDFTYIPTRALPYALEGYRSVNNLDGDDTAEARILWDHLARAIARIKRPPLKGIQYWSSPTGGPIIELIAAISSSSIQNWHEYLR